MKHINFLTPAAFLLLRLVFGFRIFYGVIDNVISWPQMLEFSHFLASFNFPLPLVSAVVSVYIQLLASISWFIGFKIRFFSILMIINFVVALAAVHLQINDTFLNMYDAISLLAIAIFFSVAGAGKFALDHYIKKGKKSGYSL